MRDRIECEIDTLQNPAASETISLLRSRNVSPTLYHHPYKSTPKHYGQFYEPGISIS